MNHDLRSGAKVSWYSNSGRVHGVWRRATVKRLTSNRVVLALEKPEPGEPACRAVTYGVVEPTWKRAEEYERDGNGV